MRRREDFHEKILTAGRLIAPVIDDNGDWLAGYKWVMDQVKQDFEVYLSISLSLVLCSTPHLTYCDLVLSPLSSLVLIFCYAQLSHLGILSSLWRVSSRSICPCST